ncbi:hypothetical protein EV191_12266 [Tamaricihabitans halophyticus]|uniref:Uncharacterized protein n=1 Tax=Tamaricihabitans halophyticus TaxID=1262583 RepID=A0A4R2Q3Z8_9PSEU|nr:hypothetical protein EV191_12266 [Tamaricihabitans halophyticus]
MIARLERAHEALVEVVPVAVAKLDSPDEPEVGECLRQFNDAFHDIVHNAGGTNGSVG